MADLARHIHQRDAELFGAGQQGEAQFFIRGVLAVANAGDAVELQQACFQFFNRDFQVFLVVADQRQVDRRRAGAGEREAHLVSIRHFAEQLFEPFRDVARAHVGARLGWRQADISLDRVLIDELTPRTHDAA